MLKAHSHQTLKTHLNGVLEWAHYTSIRNGLNVSPQIEFELILHDIGKATKDFQKYLVDQKKSEFNKHGLLSGVLAYQLLILFGIEKTKAFLGFIRIKHHHTNLVDTQEDSNLITEEEIKILKSQLASIPIADLKETYQTITALSPEVLDYISGIINKKNILESFQTFNDDRRNIRSIRRKEIRAVEQQPTSEKLKTYFDFTTSYGLILLSDKLQASGALPPSIGEITSISPAIIEKYKAQQVRFQPGWGKSRINDMRQRAYMEAEQTLQSYLSNAQLEQGNIFTLELPTGTGKTLTGLHTALLLRQLREEQRGVPPRIIYALPFMCIIDQNYGVFKDVLNTAKIPLNPDILNYHHHLSKVKEDDNEYSYGTMHLLLESWQSEITLTTFVQLFQTLISNKNKSLKRIPLLHNAVLIIDEIQAIAPKYWELIRQVFLYLANSCGTDIIIMTATKPYIFLPEDPVLPLCQPENYYKDLDRINVHYHKTQLTIEKLVEDFTPQTNKRYLFIVNTIRCARELFENLVKKFPEDEIGYLTTQIVMKQRKQRIDEIKQGRYHFVVTTQLVEAGVDIDFDEIYRDFAPLECINQASGRCNRNDRNLTSTVNVIRLVNPQNSDYASYIYNSVLLAATKLILDKNQFLEEKQFLDILDQYFSSLRTRKMISQDESEAILTAMGKLQFADNQNSTCVNKFKLIEEYGKSLPVYIEINEEAEQLWHKFEKIEEIQDPITRHIEFLKIKSDFYSYVITLHISRNVTNLPPLDKYGRLGHITLDMLHHYYDINTGYQPEGTDHVLIL